jgi:cbb3-type cytochrome oxidase subunit 3
MEGSEFVEFALAMVFFVAFLVGSYWWIVFGPGKRM